MTSACVLSVCAAALILCLSLARTTDAVKWVNCPSAALKGKVSNVVVVGCETTPICVLKKGANASIEIDFIPSENSKEATSVVHGYIAGVPFPFSPPNPKVCKDSGVTCPLVSGQAYTYKTNIFVRSEYPSVSVKVKWEIQDTDGNDIVCIELPAKISGVSSSSSSSSSSSRLLYQPRQRL